MSRIVSPEVTALIDSKDWSATPLGAQASWTPALAMILDVVLSSRFPTVFWWGPELIQFYNDRYRPILGAKHPVSLGQPARRCWAEIWRELGPLIDPAIVGAESAWSEDLLLDIDRHGFTEECIFTFGCSPIPDPQAANGIGGVLATVQETTRRVIGERRMTLLRDLGARSSEAKSERDECAIAAEVLGRYRKDLPFALIYLVDEARKRAELAAASGIDPHGGSHPATIDLESGPDPWSIALALREDAVAIVPSLTALAGLVPAGPWPEAPRAAASVPIKSSVLHQPFGVLVAGLSPRLQFDDSYRGFLELVSAQVATAIARARAYEDERKRAEALAEIDRAKTVFFSNVSHELRTPLTLMLGPLEELARDAHEHHLPLIDTARRNALRLLKLVNTLLEFSRIEAGRAEASFEPEDLAALTRDLASAFRSAVESAGVRFVVQTEDVGDVRVDRIMWEKIVLNLLSNALKFTFEGEIRVSLSAHGESIELRVADTGSGISIDDLGHVFERFRSMRTARARSREGTGIGLALVQELVVLHGGTVAADSTLGSGTTFVVRIPRRGAEPPGTRSAVSAPSESTIEQYLADVEGIALPGRASEPAVRRSAPDPLRHRVLVVDDNRDLREYMVRLLSGQFEIVVASNGAEALTIARESHVDLVVSDVMMPVMDGFELLAAVRADKRLERTPFILLSARAGQESAVEGLGRGADDYLVKPFSSEELQARVAAHINVATIRERAYQELQRSEREAQRVADAFQRAALPTALPETAGVVFDATYEPGADEARVGGDWFDALVLADGRIMVSIGDVMGSGLKAAVTMASMREIVRGVAQIHADPLAILAAADRTLKEENPDALVTAFVGIYDAVEGVLTFASAGHPPPILRAPDRTIVELHGQGLPLGLRLREHERSAVVPIAPDSLIVFYTDGLTEATRDTTAGEERLRAVVAALDADRPRAAQAIHDLVLDGPSRDDVAIMTMSITGASSRRWTLDPGLPASAAAIRTAMGDDLRSRGVADADVLGCERIFSELIGEVARHDAGGELTVTLQWVRGVPIVHVLDRAPVRRDVPAGDGAPGFRASDAMVRDFNVTPRTDGGSHVRVALRAKAGHDAEQPGG